MDQAILFANANNCSVIIANDPDADRLCVAEKRQDGTYEDTHPNNGWKIFTGNEIGTMLGHRQMMQYKADRKNGAGSGKEAGVLASVVSSRMLKQMAKAEGIHYFDTLTGFKWLGNKSIELQAKDMEILFSYEEALGFCVGTVVNDKDGISAATIFVELVCELNEKSPGSNTVVQDHLQSLYDTYGEFAAYNSYVISHDGQVTDAIFHRLRNSGGVNNDGTGYWTECAGSKIVSIQDITKGYSFSASADSDSKQDKLPCTPDSHMIMFEFENGVSVTLRTSGTEPKIKFYTEIAGSVGEKREIIEKKLHAFVEKLVEEMLQPTLHKLGRP